MKTLVVFYSLEGNTRAVAQIIAKSLGADLFEIKGKKYYNLASAVALSKLHIDSKKMIEIEEFDLDLNDYDTVYIGTPVWWFTFTPPIRAFLNKVSLDGKKVNIFCTHGGDPGKTIPDLTELLKGAKVMSGTDFYTTRKLWSKEEKWKQKQSEVLAWVEYNKKIAMR